MKNKIWTILFCSVVLAISIVLLIVFFVPRDKNHLELKQNELVTNDIDDITMTVGDKLFDYYKINSDSAEITFKLDKEGIININKSMIEGLKVGEVNVEMTAKDKNLTSTLKFKVIVCERDFTVNLKAINGCEINNDSILISQNTFQFSIEVLDKSLKKMENVKYDLFSNLDETIIDKSFASIMVVAEKQCVLTFVFPDLNIKFSRAVVLNKKP